MMWMMDDIIKWTGVETYEKVKRAPEDKTGWKIILVKLLAEDDK